MISFDEDKEGELTAEEEDEEEEESDTDSGEPSPVSLASTVAPKKRGGTKKSKLASKKVDRRAAARDNVRELGRCAFCGNLLSMTEKIHTQEVKGLKDKMKAAGKLTVALCDDCQANLDAGKTVDLKTAMVEAEDGSIQNVAISDILMAEQQEELLQKGRRGSTK